MSINDNILTYSMNLKILTYNMHKGIGWGGEDTIDTLYEQIQLLKPNVVFLQEVCDHHIKYFSTTLFPYVSYGKNVDRHAKHHGNAILSEFPILHSQNTDISVGKFERRGLLHAAIHHESFQMPIHLVCTHLGLLKKYRHQQLQTLVEYINKHVPSQLPLIIGGDFNDWRSHATIPMIQQLGLEEAFLSKHGNYAKTFPAWIPLLKLDRIYTRGFSVGETKRLNNSEWKKLSDHLALNVELNLNLGA